MNSTVKMGALFLWWLPEGQWAGQRLKTVKGVKYVVIETD